MSFYATHINASRTQLKTQTHLHQSLHTHIHIYTHSLQKPPVCVTQASHAQYITFYYNIILTIKTCTISKAAPATNCIYDSFFLYQYIYIYIHIEIYIYRLQPNNLFKVYKYVRVYTNNTKITCEI